MSSEVLLTHLFFPGCVRLVGGLAHFWCSSSDPSNFPCTPKSTKTLLGTKGVAVRDWGLLSTSKDAELRRGAR